MITQGCVSENTLVVIESKQSHAKKVTCRSPGKKNVFFNLVLVTGKIVLLRITFRPTTGGARLKPSNLEEVMEKTREEIRQQNTRGDTTTKHERGYGNNTREGIRQQNTRGDTTTKQERGYDNKKLTFLKGSFYRTKRNYKFLDIKMCALLNNQTRS